MSAHECQHCQNVFFSHSAYQRHVGGGCAAAAGSASPKLGNSFEIRVNGKLLMSVYIRDQPKDDSSMLALLKELVAMLDAPEESDSDLDGQYDNCPSVGATEQGDE